MYSSARTILIGSVFPWVHYVDRHLGCLDNSVARSSVSALGWFIVLFTPLVAFEAGGGQTAVDVIQYVVFRGLDRDAWNAASSLAITGGVLSSAAVLFGLIIHSIGLVFRDWSLLLLGCGALLTSLLMVLLSTHPVSGISMFGTLALPNYGWWLTLLYVTFTLRMVRHWRK